MSNELGDCLGPPLCAAGFYVPPTVSLLHHPEPCGPREDKPAPSAEKPNNSDTGTRTRVAWVKARYPNQLDYIGRHSGKKNTIMGSLPWTHPVDQLRLIRIFVGKMRWRRSGACFKRVTGEFAMCA